MNLITHLAPTAGRTFDVVPLHFNVSTLLEPDKGWSSTTAAIPLPFILFVGLLFLVLVCVLFRLHWYHRQPRHLTDERTRHLAEQNQALEAAAHRQEAVNKELEQSNHALSLAHHDLETSHEELNHLYAQLQEATLAKEKFYINVSHDLRTPLTLVADPIAQLLKADNLTEQQQTLVQLAHKNVHILMRMVGQILDFGKLESHDLTLTLREVDIRAALNEWGALFRSAARAQHVTLSIDVVSAAGYVMALDVEKVEHIFFNLMTNALKFTPSGGHIWVQLQQQTLRGREMLQLIVTDDGPGMTPQQQAHIFERFYKADPETPGGSGIGLVLVKAFAELHEGKISVHSELGHGTTFTVSLPIRHVAEPTTTEAPHIYGRTETSDASFAEELARVELPEDIEIDMDADTVLVIDDNPDMRVLLHSILSAKYTVLQASGGAQGFKMAMKYLPALILCDVVMPGIDGMEVCRRIKKEPLTAHIPVLLLTACALDEQRIEGYACGADAYISKPFENQMLIARCEALIANRRTLYQNSLLELTSPTGAPAAASSASGSNPAAAIASERTAQAAVHPLEVESEFYRQFLSLVEAEIGNPDLSVVDLAGKMGLSRVQFYRKIKAVTNYAPAELLRILRLKRAATMLKTTERTVAEISYAVGFSSPSYFARCYRDYFGESPTAVQERTSKI
jgi:signal transduction histidine kinase/DNA-binding response OmpR family regulator